MVHDAVLKKKNRDTLHNDGKSDNEIIAHNFSWFISHWWDIYGFICYVNDLR